MKYTGVGLEPLAAENSLTVRLVIVCKKMQLLFISEVVNTLLFVMCLWAIALTDI